MIHRLTYRIATVASAAALFLLTACGSPNLDQRIARDRDAFDSWEPEVREAITEGRIEVGFSREQVRMAWGEPSDIRVEETAEGKVEIWLYTKSSPSIGIGLGMGSFGSHTGVSGGVGTTVGGKTNILALVRFQKGLVTSFERAGSEEAPAK